MPYVRRSIVCMLAPLVFACVGEAREWTDATGKYKIEADLVGFDDESVVLRRADKQLGAVPIEKLSEKDREYLKSDDAEKIDTGHLSQTQTWTGKDGHKLVGRIVDYVRRDMTIQRRRGRTYVNDRAFGNLPEFYQQVVPAIVNHFHALDTVDRRGLEAWARRQGEAPRTFNLEGVIFELESGDEYGIPFFLFADKDRKLLEAGWEEWLAVSESHDQRDDHAFRLESLAAEYSKDQQVDRQIALMQLNMQAIAAGVTSAWEVTLYPGPGNTSPPRWVVVSGRNSAQATAAAVTQNPGFVAGPVRRVSW